jgi:hypothetical protein
MQPRTGPLEEDARNTHAVAAIRVLPARNGVEVWMADETSGRSLLRQIIVDERPGGPDQGLIALQTAELIRTSLFPKPDKPAVPEPKPNTQPPAPLPPNSPQPAREHPRGRETSVQAGFGSLWSPKGTSPSLQLWLSLRQSLARRLGLGLDLSAPARRGTISGGEGSGDLGAYLVGLELFASLVPPERPWYLDAGLCATWVRIQTDGHAKAPLIATSSSATLGAGLLRLDAGWSGSRWLRIGATLLAGATGNRLTIRFAGNQAGTWGWPVLAAFATAELRWE